MSSDGFEPSTTYEFSKALERLRAAAHILAKATAVPKQLDLAIALEKIGATGASVAKPDSSLLERTREAIISASSRGRIEEVPRSLLRQAPWLLWTEKDPLAEIPGLIDAVFRLARRSVAVLRNLIEAWIEACGRNIAGVGAAGKELRRILEQSDDARLAVWKAEIHQKINIFDIENGPRAVALAILDSSDPVERLISAFGFDQPLRAVGGYARLVQKEVLKGLTERLQTDDAKKSFERAMEFTIVNGQLRFGEPNFRGLFADALLAPWGLVRDVSNPVTGQIQKLLIHQLGDPRIKSANWHDANEHSKKTIRAWLSSASLQTFFDVIADHADKDFKYRRSFWTAYLKAGAIHDAWLALGTNVWNAAKTIPELDGGYGYLDGTAPDKSAILFQIGNYLFCEYSHSGALRVWPLDERFTPKLHQNKYQHGRLMHDSMKFPEDPGYRLNDTACDGKGLWHVGGKKGRWQIKASRFIGDKCRIYLTQKDWMPQ
jgi:hypothetical protein